MFNYVKNSLSKLIKSRLIVLVVLFALLAGILIQRLYTMQIINGEKYLTDFTMQIKKETTLKSTRGNIYDRDGNAVAIFMNTATARLQRFWISAKRTWRFACIVPKRK